MRKVRLITVIALAVMSAVSVMAEGQKDSEYPSRDIQFYVSGGAGGGTDTISRKLSSVIEKKYGITMPVVNKPGKAEAEAALTTMGSRPDGYSIGNVTYGACVSTIYHGLIPGYSLDQMKFVALVTQEADALMVASTGPWKTFDDFIADAKANPGKLRIGITSIGGRPNMVTAQMEEIYGVKFSQIEYVDGASAQREALLSGECDAAITSLGDFSSVLKSGQVRGLVEYSTAQNETYPDVPPISELGHPELEIGSFIAIVVPKDTPQPIVDKVEEMFYEAQHSDEFRNWILSVGVTPTWMGQDEVGSYIAKVQKSNFAVLDKMKAQGLIQ